MNVQEPDQLEYTLYNITGSSCYGYNGSMSMLKEELLHTLGMVIKLELSHLQTSDITK